MEQKLDNIAALLVSTKQPTQSAQSNYLSPGASSSATPDSAVQNGQPNSTHQQPQHPGLDPSLAQEHSSSDIHDGAVAEETAPQRLGDHGEEDRTPLAPADAQELLERFQSRMGTFRPLLLLLLDSVLIHFSPTLSFRRPSKEHQCGSAPAISALLVEDDSLSSREPRCQKIKKA